MEVVTALRSAQPGPDADEVLRAVDLATIVAGRLLGLPVAEPLLGCSAATLDLEAAREELRTAESSAPPPQLTGAGAADVQPVLSAVAVLVDFAGHALDELVAAAGDAAPVDAWRRAGEHLREAARWLRQDPP